MIEQKNLAALVNLLNRTPMTLAETLWAQMFIKKLESLLAVNRSENEEAENDN